MVHKEVLISCLLCVAAQALASSDDRFIKKYAMMKIYESCFGPEVVKQIRQEMKDAYAKCSAPPSFEEPPNLQTILQGKLPPGFSIDPTTQTIIKPAADGGIRSENDLPLHDRPSQNHLKGSPLGGVLAFRPHESTPPFPQQPSVPPYMMQNNPQFRPFSAATPFYQFPYNAGLFYPGAPGMQYNPYAYQQQQQQYPTQGYFQQVQQPYFGGNRMSREMDLRDRLEVISRGPQAGKVRNITCVMQELGYIDHKLEPNYEQITQRIANLPVSAELKGDIQDGLQFCQKFSQCVPDVKRDVAPLSQELIKPMFFFRCYKHKKLEACIMKDIRERFTSEDELDTDTDFRSLSRSARSVREEPLNDPRFEALDEMAVYLYDYLSGGNSFDFDLYM